MQFCQFAERELMETPRALSPSFNLQVSCRFSVAHGCPFSIKEQEHSLDYGDAACANHPCETLRGFEVKELWQ